jgi:hypothetical protein
MLEHDKVNLQNVLTRLLNLLKESSLPTSVLVHSLICLSYLSKERFSQAMEEVSFPERICEFVDWYSGTANPTTNEEPNSAMGGSSLQ